MQQLTIADFFKAVSIDFTEMEVEKPIDIKHLNYEIDSWDSTTNKRCWRRINKIVRKEDDFVHSVINVETNSEIMRVSPFHMFYVKFDDSEPTWIEACALCDQEFYIFSVESKWIHCSIICKDEMTPILDVEVEGTNCYFSNGLLSHNTMYGDPMTTPGGKALPYHASVRVRLFAGQKKKVEKKGGVEGEDAGDIYGIHTSAKIVKNRLGPPWRKCEFDILFASGVDDEGSWFQRLHEAGEIEKADGWCYLSGLPCGRLDEKGVNAGKDRGMKFRERGFKEFVNSDPNIKKFVLDALERNMIVKYGEPPKDAELDTESLMEVESAIQVATEVK